MMRFFKIENMYHIFKDVYFKFLLNLQSPVSHCWSDVGHFKRKFCNVCRKRLEDSLSVRCEGKTLCIF